MKLRIRKKRATRSRRASRTQYVHAMGCVVCNMRPFSTYGSGADVAPMWEPGELRSWKYEGSNLRWARIMAVG